MNNQVCCSCTDMEVCSECLSTRAKPCPGLPQLGWNCSRINASPGEIVKYGHCVGCESLAKAERHFRSVKKANLKDPRLSDLPLPGHVTQKDAVFLLRMFDNLVTRCVK